MTTCETGRRGVPVPAPVPGAAAGAPSFAPGSANFIPLFASSSSGFFGRISMPIKLPNDNMDLKLVISKLFNLVRLEEKNWDEIYNPERERLRSTTNPYLFLSLNTKFLN